MKPASALDARTVPAAVAAWAAAFVVVALPPTASLVTAATLTGAGAVVVWWHRRRRAGRRQRHREAPRDGPAGATVGLVVVATGLVVLAGAGHVHARSSGLLAELGPQRAAVTVVATVVSDPRPVVGAADRGGDERGPPHDQLRVRVRVESIEGRGRQGVVRAPVLVLGPPEWATVAMGEQVRTSGRLVPVEAGDDVVALLIATAPEVTAPAPAHQRLATAMRTGLLTAVADATPQAQGLVPGIAVGDDTAMPADLDAAMKAVSLTHITAVSGAHVAIILGTVLACLAWAPPWARAVVGAVVLVGFVVLVRPEASVLRSATMGAIALVALLVGRPARALPALGASVVVLLLLDPWLARSYGFVLSVLATGGLVVLAGPWAARLATHMPRSLAHMIAVPAAAQVCCAPVIILLEPAIAAYAVPANVLAAPAVPPATVLGVLATVVSPWWPWLAEVLVVPASWATAWIAGVARVTANVPGAVLPWPGGGIGAVLLAALTVAALVALARGHGRWVLPAGLVLLVAALPGPRVVVGGWLGLGPPADWVAAQCDVGQGSAFVLRTGPRSAVVLDVGPSGEAADECLRELGVREIDLLVLSHLHADHVGGLDAVLAGREVREALIGPHGAPAAAESRVLAALAAAEVPVRRPVAADSSALAGNSAVAGRSAVAGEGAVEWWVLGPTARAVQLARPGDDGVTNDLSLVVLVRVGDLTVLAPGDVEPAGQRALLRAWADRDGVLATAPAPDVVLVPHHGSAAHLPELAATFAPRLALASVGADNDFGHPAPGTLAAYREAGALVLRTDECGMVTLHHHGGGVVARAGCGPP